MNIIRLDWDSKLFKLNIGKIELNESSEFDISSFQDEKRKEKFDLIYIFSRKDIFNKQQLDASGVELKDILITMSLDLKKNEFPETSFKLINTLDDNQLIDCLNIVRETAKVSRFYFEPKIGKHKAEKLYENWLFNALNKEYADGVLVETDSESKKITSVFIPKTDLNEGVGLCSIIGVHPDFKGQGLGKKIWNKAFNYWLYKDITKIYVPFSIFNKPSFDFHLKLGFNQIIETKYIYHYTK